MTEIIQITSGKELPKSRLSECETLEGAERLCLPGHPIYAFNKTARSGKYVHYYIEQEVQDES